MQYLIGLLWVVYIIHALRRAYAEQWIAQAVTRMRHRFASIQPGMTADEVQARVGGPDRVRSDEGAVVWLYRTADDFRSVTFSGGTVCWCHRQSRQEAGKREDQNLPGPEQLQSRLDNARQEGSTLADSLLPLAHTGPICRRS